MPPKTRGSKVTKALKENIGANTKNKQKTSNRAQKPYRKVLADKTNSASDDNASSHVIKKNIENEHNNLLVKQRPRRDRRLPNRFVEYSVLQNLSNSKNVSIDSEEPSKSLSITKNPVVVLTPLKISKTNLDKSLIARKSKRICRLPSTFEEYSMSPSKCVPVQPVHASTPKIQSKLSNATKGKHQHKNASPNSSLSSVKVLSTKVNRKRTVQKKSNDISKNDSADTNNNAKDNLLPHNKTKIVSETSPEVLLNTNTTASRKLPKTNFSFKILEDKKKSLKRDSSNIDVYEFTYDPNEEPPPTKKKRRRPVKKKEPKPKTVTFKNNYDRNLAKALTALKNAVFLNSAKTVVKADKPKELTTDVNKKVPLTLNVSSAPVNTEPISVVPTVSKEPTCNPEKSQASKINYNSVRVEDIALDFEPDSCVDDLNYSPLNSPSHHIDPASSNVAIQNQDRPARHNDDPLNLRDDLSFFDDQPVASSSMNVSVRHPAASPWRVEFGNLPIKWQVNTYVKPNMTPAFESSFINFNDSKKKHVYTDLGPDTNEANDLPQIYEDNTSKLKQTSIISFIKEVVEKSAKKRKEKMTPIKDNSLFEGINNSSILNDVHITQKQDAPNKIVQKNATPNKESIAQNKVISNIISENREESVNKSSKKKKDKDITYFGFDENDSQDQENVSPIKKIDKRRLRALKPRSRAVLQEINQQLAPTRATVPVTIKSKPINAANELFDQVISATEPPIFPEKEAIQSTETNNVTELQTNDDSNDDDGQSVHLFEDVEVVHHLKAQRKSYGKTKKAVTFRQNSISDSEIAASDIGERSYGSDDDLHDLTFKMPALEPGKATKKKKSKKRTLSKKEKQELEAWAAGFNSMCEDIEEFDLVLE